MLSEKRRRIKLLLLDVDGVLTDGGILYGESGAEIKVFDVKDGFGIKLLRQAGIEVGIVTGRSSGALCRRCADLGILYLFDNVQDKTAVLQTILDRLSLSVEEVAYVGDDLPDLAIMKRVGLPIAVADAHPAVVETAAWVTTARGGSGAVREICETILTSKGVWESILAHYRK